MDKTGFKNSNLFEKYDRWIDSMIANDYYHSEIYDDDGNLISEASFDDDSFEKAKDEILDISISIYEEIAHGRIFTNHPVDLSGNKIDHASIFSDLLHHYDYWDAVLLSAVYYLFIYDYPNYPPICGNRRLFMRIYNELFTRVSVYINCIKEWLDLYSSLRNITSVLALPPCLRDERVLKCLQKLKEHGFLDDNYKLTLLVARRGAWHHLIAQKLNYKGCSYSELEKHFNIANMRDSRGLDSFLNRKRKSEAKESDIEIYNTINNCFA
jgi:hypothetical protein